MAKPPYPQKSSFSKTSSAKPSADISKDIENFIKSDLKTLKDYPIRTLVEHAQIFGPELKQQRLETNQIRKFLDAINQVKSKLPQAYEEIRRDEETSHKKLSPEEIKKVIFGKIEPDIILLKPKLAYAAARQRAVKPLNDVMAAAIDKVTDEDDFKRLVQFIESIIAYHKAEGGK